MTAKAIAAPADLDAAVEHIQWCAKYQSAGFIALTVMHDGPDSGLLVEERRWFDNRDLELAIKVKRLLRKHANRTVTVLYSAGSYSEKQAKAAHALPSRLAFVDADNSVVPGNVPRPSRRVASSAHNQHQFWVLNRAVSPVELQRINRILTTAVKGDKGGHSPAKMFRLPGFPNFKHTPAPLVRVTVDSDTVHDVDTLLSLSGDLATFSPAVAFIDSYVIDEAANIEPTDVIAKFQPQLGEGVLLRINQRRVYRQFKFNFQNEVYHYGGDDRSEIIWFIGVGLKAAGATPAENLAVVRNTVFSRERVREGKAEDLLRFIRRVYEHEVTSNDGQQGSVNTLAIDPADWANLPVPVRQWIVEDLLPLLKVTLIYGDGGTGKTLLVLMLAIAAVSGKLFLGLKVKQVRVFALLGENDNDDTRITLESVCRHYGVGLGDLRGKMRIASRVGLDNVLMSFATRDGKHSRLFEILLQEIKDFGASLVILDTAADLFDGNENARNEVRRFMSECCGRIAIEAKAAVLVCAHPSVTGLRTGDGSSGSTAWSNSARSRLYLRREVDDKGHEPDRFYRVLELKKSNHAQIGQSIGLRWIDGVFVVDDPVKNRHANVERERVVLAEVERAFAASNPWSANHQGGPRFIVPWMKTNLKISHSAAKELLHRMINNGEIVEVEYNKHLHRRGLATPEQAAKQQRNKEAK